MRVLHKLWRDAFSRGNSNMERSTDRCSRGGKEAAAVRRARCVHTQLHSMNGGLPLAPPPVDLPYLSVVLGNHISPSGILLLSQS